MDSELKLRLDYDEAESAFIAAKKNRDKDPDGYAVAKAKLHQMRTHWRGIRDAIAGSTIKTIEAKARSN